MDIIKARELINAGKVEVKDFEELKIKENREVFKNMKSFDYDDDDDGFNRLVFALPFLCKFDGEAPSIDIILELTIKDVDKIMKTAFKKKEV